MSTEMFIVTHRIPLRGAETTAVVAALNDLQGVNFVEADSHGRHIRISYDLRHLSVDDIEMAVDACGGQPAKGLISALRRAWVRFTDDNTLTTVAAPVSPCCSRPPTGK